MKAVENTASPNVPVVVSDEARAIHSRSFIFDGHNDLPWEVRGTAVHALLIRSTFPNRNHSSTPISALAPGGRRCPVLVGVCSGAHRSFRVGPPDDAGANRDRASHALAIPRPSSCADQRRCDVHLRQREIVPHRALKEAMPSTTRWKNYDGYSTWGGVT